MNLQKRNERIRKLRKKYNLTKLAKLYNLSLERVRQILNPEKLSYCQKHQRRHSKNKACSLCYILKYYPKVLENNHIKEELRLLKIQDRKIETVYMRSLLIKYLINKKGLTLNEVASLLFRDLTSIVNLYKKIL